MISEILAPTSNIVSIKSAYLPIPIEFEKSSAIEDSVESQDIVKSLKQVANYKLNIGILIKDKSDYPINLKSDT